MSQPQRVLIWMLGFLALIATAAVLLYPSLRSAFGATPYFNGVILGVFAIGIAVNLRQVLRLQREVRWIEGYRRSNPDRVQEPPIRRIHFDAAVERPQGRHLGPRSLRRHPARA